MTQVCAEKCSFHKELKWPRNGKVPEKKKCFVFAIIFTLECIGLCKMLRSKEKYYVKSRDKIVGRFICNGARKSRKYSSYDISWF